MPCRDTSVRFLFGFKTSRSWASHASLKKLSLSLTREMRLLQAIAFAKIKRPRSVSRHYDRSNLVSRQPPCLGYDSITSANSSMILSVSRFLLLTSVCMLVYGRASHSAWKPSSPISLRPMFSSVKEGQDCMADAISAIPVSPMRFALRFNDLRVLLRATPIDIYRVPIMPSALNSRLSFSRTSERRKS